MPRRERPLNGDGGILLRFAADLRQLREKAGSPTYRELAHRAHYSAATLSEAAGGRKLPSLAATLGYVRACDGDVTAWEQRWHETAAELAGLEDDDENPGADDQASPYAGLAPLQPTDAQRFFGRERLVAELLTRLARRRLVTVFGASGAGKSSLLRAGLLPAIRSGALDDAMSDDDTGPSTGPAGTAAAPTGNATARTGTYATLLFSPGARPLEELAIHLGRFSGDTPGRLLAELDGDRRAVHRLVRRAVGGGPDQTGLVIVVDQFEEVFTLCADPRERGRFVDLLVSAATADQSRVAVVLGVRADFYTHCTTLPGLLDAMRHGQVVVGPMSTDELRRAITQPAVQAGCAVEGALVSRLIGDATGQPAVLPLVSHALLETWRRRRGNTLTLAGYEAAGGIERAIAQTAERAYADVDADQRRIVRQIFLRLTALGEGTEDTKRRVRREELDGLGPGTGEVLERLAAARLLVLDHDSVEIAHEALIRGWPRLRGWLTADREGLRVHRQLTEAAGTWATLGREAEALYRGTRLALAADRAGRDEELLSPVEREFLAASLGAEARERAVVRRRSRRLRQFVAVLTVLLVVSVAATGYAARAERAATEQRNIAVSQLVAGQTAALRELDPGLAAQLSLAAYELVPTPEARTSLLSASAARFATRVTEHDARLSAATFSSDGRLLATAGADRTVRLLDVDDPHRPEQVGLLAGHSHNVESVDFSPDGHSLATASYDGTVRLWNVSDPRSPELLTTFTAHQEAVHELAYSPDGRTVATAGGDHTVRLWDVTDLVAARPIGQLTGHSGAIGMLVFSPDGRTVATASDDHRIGLWDVTDPRRPAHTSWLTGHTDRVEAVAFAPDGRRLVSAGFDADHQARVWDVADRRHPVPLARLTGHVGPLQSAAFSPDGRYVATAGWDHTTRLWDVSDIRRPTPVTVLTGHTNTVWWVEFSPDGRTLATASTDRSVLLTDLPGPVLAGYPAALATAVFSPDGRTAATGDEGHEVRLWDVADRYHPRPASVLAGHTGPVKAVAFSPDGRTLATAGIDRTVGLWDVTDRQRPVRLPSLTAHTESVLSVVFTPDGRYLATAGNDHTVRLWSVADPRRPQPVGELTDITDSVPALAVSRDGRTLAVATGPTVRLTDISDPARPKLLGVVDGHADQVYSVAFRPDGQVLVSAGLDRTARVSDVGDPTTPRHLATLTGHTGAVWSAAFSPDGRTLVTGGFDRTGRLWDLTDPRRPRHSASLTGHTDRVYSVAFSPDGGTVLTASEDRTALLWTVDVGRAAERICALAQPGIGHARWRTYLPGLPYQPPCD
ncbi:AAA family ATPase [Micromonospora sp. NPDC050397]|uniref:nSTAND1 domain-containing NTPase n=1 Tax=Micromonospora sp. NPDC050397 TaxID=3364279 RepID=UPI00384D2173